VVVRQKGPVFVHVMPGIMWWKLLVYIFAIALDGFYFDQTKGKGIELLARARKVFCYKKKRVGKRRARSEKQVWIAFHKLRSNLSFWVEPMSNKSVVWDYQTPQSCFYYQWQPQLQCQTGTILQWCTWGVHVHGEPVHLHHHVLLNGLYDLPARTGWYQVNIFRNGKSRRKCWLP
jgi:hypothetical protein